MRSSSTQSIGHVLITALTWTLADDLRCLNDHFPFTHVALSISLTFAFIRRVLGRTRNDDTNRIVQDISKKPPSTPPDNDYNFR